MADPTDRDADRLDAWLDSDGHAPGDELSAFARRLLRDVGLPAEPDALTAEQRERIRARALGASEHEKARPTVLATTFAPNGATATPISIREPERPALSMLSILMTAALVAIIAVAGFGLARGSLDLPGGSDDGATTDMPALAFSPVASPAAETECSRDQWSGIFTEPVPDLLADATYLRFDDGTLTLHCDGESEQIATGVRQAFTYHIGVIAIRTETNTIQLLNVVTGESIEMAPGQLLGDDGTITFAETASQENWLLVPVTAERTDWRVIDLRSMESLLLSDELGESLPEASSPDFDQITGTDVAVVTWRPETQDLRGTPMEGGHRLQADEQALVLPGSIEDRRWIHFTQFREPTNLIGGSFSQISTVSPNGSLIAYTTLTDTFEPVIRVEQAVSGETLVDVPIDGIDMATRFILAGQDRPHLVYANGDTVRIFGLAPDATHEIAEQPGPDVTWFLPTADPDTVLFVHNSRYTEITPVNVTSGERRDFWMHVPSAYWQVYGDDELPQNLVRVGSGIQLVSVSTGEVRMESDQIDAAPAQVVSFNTWLANGGEQAVVPIGYNRAVVLNAATGETWQIAAPTDDDRLWHFALSGDGAFVTAWPEPPEGTTGVGQSEYWIAPFEPGADWVLLDGITADTSALAPGTPAA